MRLARHEVTIAAPPEVVWAHLTTAEGLVRWAGPYATADPVPGGALRWSHPDGSVMVGRFLELVPHRRVVFAYGWEDGRMGVAPESTRVEIELRERNGATTLRLTHHGLPPAAVDPHEHGWTYFLGVLSTVAPDGAGDGADSDVQADAVAGSDDRQCARPDVHGPGRRGP